MTIETGSGFFYDSESNYLIDFSESQYDWAASSHYGIMFLPPLDHPLFDLVYRHEKEHARLYERLKKRRCIWFWFRFLTNSFLFNGFEEVYVSIKSQSFRHWSRQLGNLLTLLISCLWIMILIYGVLNLAFLPYLIGVFFGMFLLWNGGHIY